MSPNVSSANPVDVINRFTAMSSLISRVVIAPGRELRRFRCCWTIPNARHCVKALWACRSSGMFRLPMR
jgi:hypothetical protein